MPVKFSQELGSNTYLEEVCDKVPAQVRLRALANIMALEEIGNAMSAEA